MHAYTSNLRLEKNVYEEEDEDDDEEEKEEEGEDLAWLWSTPTLLFKIGNPAIGSSILR